MQFYQDNLPYFYETDDEPHTLVNSIERQIIWEYTVEKSASLTISGTTYPLLVERLRRKARYRFDDYYVVAAVVHEWQYLDKPDEPYAGQMQGYRVYHDGMMKQGEADILQPEAAVMLGFTPDANTVPAYIESTPKADVSALLAEAHDLCSDDSQLNAWLSVPIDAPTHAPEDISSTLLTIRREVGLRATRGRARLLQHMMKATGVTLSETGWALTPDELVRRKKASTP